MTFARDLQIFTKMPKKRPEMFSEEFRRSAAKKIFVWGYILLN